jgi:hypothetical protein
MWPVGGVADVGGAAGPTSAGRRGRGRQRVRAAVPAGRARRGDHALDLRAGRSLAARAAGRLAVDRQRRRVGQLGPRSASQRAPGPTRWRGFATAADSRPPARPAPGRRGLGLGHLAHGACRPDGRYAHQLARRISSPTSSEAGAPYLRIYNQALPGGIIPISERLVAQIRARQQNLGEHFPEPPPFLLPALRQNPDGTRPFLRSALNDRLRAWLSDCDIRDAAGQPVKITAHQFPTPSARG